MQKSSKEVGKKACRKSTKELIKKVQTKVASN